MPLSRFLIVNSPKIVGFIFIEIFFVIKNNYNKI
jgi:hypothetical protein